MGHAPVVWDFDGTLADSWADIATALNLTLEDLGFSTHPPEQIKGWIGNGVRALVREALPEGQADDATVDRILRRYRDHYDAHCLDTTVLYDGILETLDRLGDRPHVCASNKPERYMPRMLEALGIAERFVMALGGDSLEERKPHPRILSHVGEVLGVPPGSLWMVGDSETDVATGKAVGARTIGCDWGLRTRQVLEEAGPEYIVSRPSQIADMILG